MLFHLCYFHHKLRLNHSVSQNSQCRDFAAGNRVRMDIFNDKSTVRIFFAGDIAAKTARMESRPNAPQSHSFHKVPDHTWFSSRPGDIRAVHITCVKQS